MIMGRYIKRFTRTRSQKKRRHSGWVTPQATVNLSRQEMVDQALEPNPFYDDWEDYRDGQRNFHGDRTKFKKTDKLWHHSVGECDSCRVLLKNNKKLKLLYKRRLAKKEMQKLRRRSNG